MATGSDGFPLLRDGAAKGAERARLCPLAMLVLVTDCSGDKCAKTWKYAEICGLEELFVGGGAQHSRKKCANSGPDPNADLGDCETVRSRDAGTL